MGMGGGIMRDFFGKDIVEGGRGGQGGGERETRMT